MVDVGDKPESRRLASAEGRIHMHAETLNLVTEGRHKKGDVLAVARVAGIMAAKRTIELSSLADPPAIQCRATAETVARTGVEMEALTAVQVALLTVYDMCKAVDRGMTIGNVRLVEKSGGKSGHWRIDNDGS